MKNYSNELNKDEFFSYIRRMYSNLCDASDDAEEKYYERYLDSMYQTLRERGWYDEYVELVRTRRLA